MAITLRDSTDGVSNGGTVVPDAMSAGSTVLVTLLFWSNAGTAKATGDITTTMDMVERRGKDFEMLPPVLDSDHDWGGFNQVTYGAPADYCLVQQWIGVLNSANNGTTDNVGIVTGGDAHVLVHEITGADAEYPVRQHKYAGANTHSSSQVTANFDVAPLSANELFAAAIARDMNGSETMGGYTGWSNNDVSTSRTSKNWQTDDSSTATIFGATPGAASLVADQGIAFGAVEFRAARTDPVGSPKPGSLYRFSTSVSSEASDSFSVTNGDLIVVLAGGEDSGATRTITSISTTHTLDAGFNSGAFKLIASATGAGSDNVFNYFWVAKAGATGSGTCTANASASTAHLGLRPFVIDGTNVDFDALDTGVAGTDYGVEELSGASIAADTSISGTLNATPADESTVLVAVRGAGISAVGLTDRDDVRISFWDHGLFGGGDDEGGGQTQFLLDYPGDVGTDFGAQFGTAQNNGYAVVAFEVPVVSDSFQTAWARNSNQVIQ